MLFLAGFFALFVATASASNCSADARIEYTKRVGIAFNAETIGASYAEFTTVPWGAPDVHGVCEVTITPDGSGCAIPVALTGDGTIEFATAIRQAFYHLNNTAIIPFDNGTVLYSVNIALGARSTIDSTVNFHGYVYMDFDNDCRIYAARAYADVPNSVLGQVVSIALPGTLGPACAALNL